MVARTVPPNSLPAPSAGMYRAQRPTGVAMALVIVFGAFLLQSVVTMIIVVVQFFAAGIPTDFHADDLLAMTRSRLGLTLSLLSFGIALGLIWLWVRAKEKRPFASLGFEQRLGAGGKILRGLGVGLLMMLVCVLVPLLTGQATLTWSAPDASTLLVIVIMLFAFLLQGSTEEIMTRGFLTQAVARRFGLAIAIGVQALVFALMHGANPGVGPLPIVNLLLFAVFASFYSLADGSLWGVCAMHGIWNWAQGNLFGVAVSGQQTADSFFAYTINADSSSLLTGGAFGIEGSLVTTIVYLLGITLAFRAFRRRSRVAGVSHTGGGSVA